MTIIQYVIRVFRFLNTAMPGVVGLAACLTLPAQAEAVTGADPAAGAVAVSAPTSDIPERMISKAELLDHLDEVGRQYPNLYDRLRRGPRTSPPEAPSVNLPTMSGSSTTSASRSMESFLRQDVKINTSRTNVPPVTKVSR